MARLNIWIPDKEIAVIDTFCKKHQYHRGVFLWKSAVSIINSLEGKLSVISCDYCKSGSIGKFKVTTYSTELGENDVVKNLCKLHLASAQREGAVTKSEN